MQKSPFLHELNKKKKEGKKGGKGRKKGKMTILNGCLGYMPTPESPGRGPAMIMGSTAMHDSAPIDDKLFIMLLLLVGRKLLTPCLTKFLQVSGRRNLKMSPGAYDSV